MNKALKCFIVLGMSLLFLCSCEESSTGEGWNEYWNKYESADMSIVEESSDSNESVVSNETSSGEEYASSEENSASEDSSDIIVEESSENGIDESNAGECDHSGLELKNDKTYHWKECEKCGEVEKIEHSFELKSDENNHWHECICGETENKNKHNWSKWQITKDATCVEKGEQKRSCEICGLEQKKDVPVKDHEYDKNGKCKKCGNLNEHKHSYGNEWLNDEASHWYACECGQIKDKESHEWSDWETLNQPTCLEKGEEKRSCKICNFEEKKDIDALGHTYDENGKCEKCQSVCPHSQVSDWQHDEEKHWQICEICQSKINVDDHDDSSEKCKCLE